MTKNPETDCPDCGGSGRDGGSSAPCPTCLRPERTTCPTPYPGGTCGCGAGCDTATQGSGTTVSTSYTRAWCPQCGPDVAFDEDGYCALCGATATGGGAEQAYRMRELLNVGAKQYAEAHGWKEPGLVAKCKACGHEGRISFSDPEVETFCEAILGDNEQLRVVLRRLLHGHGPCIVDPPCGSCFRCDAAKLVEPVGGEP